MSDKPVPDGWSRLSLGDVVAEFCNGGTPSTTNPEYWGGPIPWITGADINDHKVGQPRKLLSLSGVSNSATHIVPKGGLLIVTRTGVGKVAIAPYDIAISQDITGALLKDGVVTSEYLYQWLISNATNLKKLNQGTSINGIVREDLGRLLVLVPPHAEQRAIAAILDSIDEAIQRTEEVITATEELRQALLHDLLTRGVPGWHTEWKHVPSIGTIPAGWDVVRLGEVAEVQTGRAVKKADALTSGLRVPYLSVANVKDGYLDLSLVKSMVVPDHEISRYSLRIGDVLFTEGGDADKLGRGCVWRGEIRPCLHQNHIFAVRPRESLLAEYLAMFAASSAGKQYFLKSAKQTTNLASVNSTQLKEMLVPLPSVPEQRQITELSELLATAVESERQAAEQLKGLKASLSDALLSGRVRVPERP